MPGGGAKCIASNHRIIRRNRRVRGARDGFGVLLELGEIVVDEAEQAAIHEHEFHGRVAHAFAERKSGGVDLICAGGDGGERICDGKAAVVMAVPVDANFFAGRL